MSYIGKQPRKAALTASDIEDGIITAAKIEDGAVVAAEIASNAVTTAKINADAVTGAKIADDAINSEHYTDGSVDTAHIADANITKAKLADSVDIFAGTSLSAADLGAGIHIKTADSGASVNSGHDEIIAEGSGNSGITILSGTSSNGAVLFGDSGNNADGYLNYDHTNRKIDFGTAGATQWAIDSSGNFLPAATDHGIYLGVTSATAANLLKDYEEGTWSPTYSDGSNTSNATVGLVGNYTKIGQFVSVCGRIYQNNSDNNGLTDGNALSIGNLPFTSTSHSNFSTSGSVSTRGSDSSVTLPTQRPTRLQLLDNTNLAQVHYDAGGTKGAISMLCSMIKMSGYNSWMYFQISYETDA